MIVVVNRIRKEIETDVIIILRLSFPLETFRYLELKKLKIQFIFALILLKRSPHGLKAFNHRCRCVTSSRGKKEIFILNTKSLRH